jgi:hypothetical protein
MNYQLEIYSVFNLLIVFNKYYFYLTIKTLNKKNIIKKLKYDQQILSIENIHEI